jgi:hypothetical protein
MMLAEADDAIRAALLRLGQKPRSFDGRHLAGPFLIIEDPVRDVFVQFAGSAEEPLTFDVPALRLTRRMWPGAGWQDLPRVVEEAAAEAIAALLRQGVLLSDEVRIIEDSGGGLG